MKIKPVQNRGGVRVELRPEETQFPSSAGETTTPETPVFILKEILVPVDFSECTEKAMSYAVPFARQFGARVTLLHVVEPIYAPATDMGVVVDVYTDEDEKCELEKLHARFAGQVRCQTRLKKGKAESEIINAAKELACDLIVLGTHGHTGLDRLLMGSTAAKVVRRAGCPILVVRPHEHDFIASNLTEWPEDGGSSEAEIEAEMKTSM